MACNAMQMSRDVPNDGERPLRDPFNAHLASLARMYIGTEEFVTQSCCIFPSPFAHSAFLHKPFFVSLAICPFPRCNLHDDHNLSAYTHSAVVGSNFFDILQLFPFI